MIVYVGCVLGYGWCIQGKVNLAGPLILQFASQQSHSIIWHFELTINIFSWLYSDSRPECIGDFHNRLGAAAQLICIGLCKCSSWCIEMYDQYLHVQQNNLIRGLLGAALVSVIDLLTTALQPGWTFVLLGCVCAALTPLVYVVIRIGPGCRARRRERENRALLNTA